MVDNFARTISLDTEINQGDNLLFSFIPVYWQKTDKNLFHDHS